MDEMPTDLVTPDPDDDEGTPQKPKRRLGVLPAKVPTKATRRERRELRKALDHQPVDFGSLDGT